MGLLDGEIANAIYRGFRGKLLTGTLRREVPGTGTDTLGDPNPGTPETYTFEGIRENYNAAFRATAGIPQTDVRILIIAGSLSTTPRRGDQIKIVNVWHKVREIESIDPAVATYQLQCFEIPDPT